MISIRRKTTEQFIAEVKDMYGEEYKVLGRYARTHEKIEMKHVLCGNEYDVTPANFLRGRKCPKCANGIRKYGQRISHEEFRREVGKAVGDEYSFLESYVNSVTAIAIRHNTCGHEYRVTPGNFLHQAKRCPKCLFSRGEQRVSEFLEDKGIRYMAQYTFPDCRNIMPLPFDFAILEDCGEVRKVIEYDGEFHYEKKFRTDKEFALQKKRDAIKTSYCSDKGIELIRIPYWEYDRVGEILLDKLTR